MSTRPPETTAAPPHPQGGHRSPTATALPGHPRHESDQAAAGAVADGAGRTASPDAVDARLEQFRAPLTGHCYRMLGSAFEAEDAVQETLVRAWRGFDRFDDDRPLRPWLFTIATNVCLSMLRSTQRRARAMDLGPASHAGASLGVPLPEGAWVQPIPDDRVLPAGGDPADIAAQRETIRLAFVAALQHLPPRQRAVLLLRDVLRWTADEVARLLDTSVAAVNSALQRARSTLAANGSGYAVPLHHLPDPAHQDLLARYCDAFERYDVDALVSLLHEEATMSMPPFAWWLRGRDEIRRALTAPGLGCDGGRTAMTTANGVPAFGQYRPSGPGGELDAFALVVLDVADGLVTDITTFLDARRLFPLFGLPLHVAPTDPR